MVGRCAFCERTDVELSVSHIVPRWAYARARDATGRAANPNPTWADGKRLVQTSRQIAHHLLCESCEQRLAVFDDYAADVSADVEGYSALFSRIEVHETPAGAAFATPRDLQVMTLALFGLAVFWRAHQSRRFERFILPLDLAEELRRVLGGELPPPRMDAVFRFSVIDEREAPEPALSTLVAWPTISQDRGHNTAMFIACGIVYRMEWGRVPLHARRLSHLTAERRLIPLEAPNDSGYLRNAIRHLLAATPGRRKLGKSR